MRSPNPSCPTCQGRGWVPNYQTRTVDPNMPGGQNDWLECPVCLAPKRAGSLIPSGGVFARAKLVLVLVFIVVPIGAIMLLQSDWGDDLFSSPFSDNMASAHASQVIWTGEAECANGTYPLIADSAHVPTMGESLSVVILTKRADVEKVLEAGRKSTRRLAESMTEEALEEVGGVPEVIIPGRLPEKSILAAVTLWGSGDAQAATYTRPGDVDGPRPGLAPRKVEARFDRDAGTITGTFSGGHCTSFTGNQ